MERNVLLKIMAACCIPEAVLICSSKDTTFSTADYLLKITWLRWS